MLFERSAPMRKIKASLDAVDRQIAAVLQGDNRLPIEKLATRVGLSPSATHRRVVRLRESGAIAAEVAVLDPKTFGLGMTFIVELILEKVRVGEVATLKARLKKAPEVQQIYNVTGDADLLLIMLARDVEHFERISRELFAADPHLRRYRTSVVVDRVKVSLKIPLNPGEAR
jgi:Lrp/AsnC family leucine-responsive transcriptional regulator